MGARVLILPTEEILSSDAKFLPAGYLNPRLDLLLRPIRDLLSSTLMCPPERWSIKKTRGIYFAESGKKVEETKRVLVELCLMVRTPVIAHS